VPTRPLTYAKTWCILTLAMFLYNLVTRRWLCFLFLIAPIPGITLTGYYTWKSLGVALVLDGMLQETVGKGIPPV
jgi:hypothetical protein